ncbi:glycosyltransferase family A protein [Kutzneria albida]|uniref:Glycosyltransferase 2-like domain-containing protein n=1 Tax=Kutzneria albida DSM 43870 TaxID=1449976 RepID=W5W8N6_9PSEU|nr:glycosyltransferase family A protein [Kutzneria albida]AHH94584.1 hypothetical protein KALB_1211 [Kutzneria albida DSM 43870]
MPVLSVLTAAHAGRGPLLAAAGESLAAQQLPIGWRLEWVVQEDGPSPHLAEVLGQFVFARLWTNNGQLGIAMTRNLALTRVSGELVHVLDSDDLLLPGALATALAAFERHPEIHWVAAQADDLMPDGTRVPYPLAFRTGYVRAGEINTFTAEHDEPPISCAGLTARTATLRALGGYAANPCSEDVALFTAMAELTPGWITPEITWLIRQHERRTTRGEGWRRLRAASVAMVHQRLAAQRSVGLRLGAAQPQGGL